jgi:hypothetical protein
MELQRLCKKMNNINSSIERAYTKDITSLLEDLFFEYDICYKDTDTKVQKEIVFRKFLAVFEKQYESKMCIGISKNGNKCCKTAQQDSDFCKVHKYLEFRGHLEKKQQENIFVIGDTQKYTHTNTENMKKKVVDGSVYYVDTSFIYDTSTLERVGYVDDDKYILTDDPFILSL